MRPLPLSVAAALVWCAGCAATPPARHYKLVAFPRAATEEPILSGPPETGGMVSGYVALAPGEGMHRHTTGANDELLVFIGGKGAVVLGDEHVTVLAGEALYVPPHTEHEVHASTPDGLRYVYTVAPAK